MLEGLDGLENISKPLSEGLTPSQTEYLAELDVEPSDWAELGDEQQFWTLGIIDGRMAELDVAVDLRSELAHEIFSIDLAEEYDDFIVETYGPGGYEVYESDNRHCEVEAPQDSIQIEQIRETLTNIEDIKYENWTSLEVSEKEVVLNAVEERIAEIECRPACPVRLVPLEEGQWGGYNPETKDITINSLYVEQSDYGTYREIVDTLIHEGRHAYQDYNVNVAEIHPRHSEVAGWAETMEGGKWGYWGDCSSLLGQRLYEQQSIEIDARNFAADVLNRLNLNA